MGQIEGFYNPDLQYTSRGKNEIQSEQENWEKGTNVPFSTRKEKNVLNFRTNEKLENKEAGAEAGIEKEKNIKKR